MVPEDPDAGLACTPRPQEFYIFIRARPQGGKLTKLVNLTKRILPP